MNSRLAPGTTVPIGWIAAGDPAELFSPDRHDELWAVQEPLDFPGTVYGVPRGTSMREIMRRQSEAFGHDSWSTVVEALCARLEAPHPALGQDHRSSSLSR